MTLDYVKSYWHRNIWLYIVQSDYLTLGGAYPVPGRHTNVDGNLKKSSCSSRQVNVDVPIN